MKQLSKVKGLFLLLAIFVMTSASFGQKYTGLSATTSGAQTPTGIFDGNTAGGQWQDGTQNVDNAWITIDLGSIKAVSTIKIYWEAANAKAYNLSFSDDNITFTGQKDYSNMAAGNRLDLVSGLSVTCRYIKMQGVTRQLPYAYCIFEFEVYPPITPALTTLVITPTNSSVALGATPLFVATGYDQIGDVITIPPSTVWSVNGTATIDETGLFSATTCGLYTITAMNSGKTATTTLDVVPTNPNLAIGKTATASSGTASLAIDNNSASRWESLATDPQWIMVNLGAPKKISDIVITWEFASAKNYIIEASIDGVNWATILTETNLAAGARTDRFYGLTTDAQYIRLTGSARTSAYAYSIYEFKIYGVASSDVYASAIAVVGTGNATDISTDKGQLQMIANLTPANTTKTEVAWSVDDSNIATIDASGMLSAVNNGSVIVTAKTTDGSNITNTLAISITNQITLSTSIIVTGENNATTISTKGGTLQMFAEVLPVTTSDKTVTWSVDDESVATIDANSGILTAVMDGDVNVTATANDGLGVTGTIKITVSNQKVKVAMITITSQDNAGSITVKGGTLQLFALVEPADAYNKAIVWSVNTDVATISETGLLTAVSNGTANVKVSATDGSGLQKMFYVEILNQTTPVNQITVSSQGDVISIAGIGSTLQFSAAVLPQDATVSSVQWSVDNPTLASISASGLVTTKGYGDIEVTATAKDGSNVSGTFKLAIINQTAIRPTVYSASANSVTVYPNPAKELVYISGTQSFANVTIFNLLGQSVSYISNYEAGTAIDISTIAPGTYVVQLTSTSGEIERLKFVKR